jgi:hypothetical protein
VVFALAFALTFVLAFALAFVQVSCAIAIESPVTMSKLANFGKDSHISISAYCNSVNCL